ncbi:hypothetical protein CWR43_18970 [Rhizobium sullae]|uniref:Uncharacterized protein n=1 Tax=Rhizobium sullae TaxID=50338 RepID=A0A2N0D7W0_RHISU|nr:hypothetical protein CWR43_18970 [Rhizobium sullae]
MTTIAGHLRKKAAKWPRVAEPIFASAVNGESGRLVMNRGYFDAILVSLVVAGCYMFLTPM